MSMKQVVVALGLAVAGSQAQCVGPQINSAALNLIKSFESWQPNICEFPAFLLELGK